MRFLVHLISFSFPGFPEYVIELQKNIDLLFQDAMQEALFMLTKRYVTETPLNSFSKFVLPKYFILIQIVDKKTLILFIKHIVYTKITI